MAKPTNKTDKIRDQITALQAKLNEAEAAEEGARMKRIERAARRTGILKLDIPQSEIEAALRALVSGT